MLSEADEAAVRAHLETCPTCTQEHDEMLRAARMLPFAVQEVETTGGARESLMQRIASEPRALRPVRVNRPAWQRFAAIAAVAALLIALGGVVGASLFGSSDDALTREAANQRTLVQAVAQGTASRDTSEAGGAKAMLVFAPGTRSAFAWLEGLPALPAGKDYQAWFIDSDSPKPSTAFASAGGVWVDSPADVDGFSAFALTIEDKGGVPKPTQDPFIVVDLNAAARQPIGWQDWLAMTAND